MATVAVFIDGMSVRCRLEECRWTEDYDVLHLAQRVAGNRALWRAYYYITRPDQAQLGPQRYARYRSYLAKVKRQAGVCVRDEGYMVNRNGVWEEKMVDVLLAADLVYFACLGCYDTAIVVTADNDLVPAIERTRALGKKVELIVFIKAKPKVCNLVRVCSLHRAARRSHFVPI